jgi:hypothetical protein
MPSSSAESLNNKNQFGPRSFMHSKAASNASFNSSNIDHGHQNQSDEIEETILHHVGSKHYNQSSISSDGLLEKINEEEDQAEIQHSDSKASTQNEQESLTQLL